MPAFALHLRRVGFITDGFNVDVRGTPVRLLTYSDAPEGGVDVYLATAEEYLQALRAGVESRVARGEIDLATPEGGYASAMPYPDVVRSVITDLHRCLSATGSDDDGHNLAKVGVGVARAARRLADAGRNPLKQLPAIRERTAADDEARAVILAALEFNRERPQPLRPTVTPPSRTARRPETYLGSNRGLWWTGSEPRGSTPPGWGLGKMRATRRGFR